MTKISSRLTFANKRIFPVVWFGSLVFIGGKALAYGTTLGQPVVLIALAIMAGVGLIIMRFFVWDLADEVHDCGGHLLVRKGTIKVRIPFEDVMNVNWTTMTNPSRVTLHLAKPCALGSTIVFSPRVNCKLNPFAKNAVAEDILKRAHTARTKSAPEGQ